MNTTQNTVDSVLSTSRGLGRQAARKNSPGGLSLAFEAAKEAYPALNQKAFLDGYKAELAAIAPAE